MAADDGIGVALVRIDVRAGLQDAERTRGEIRDGFEDPSGLRAAPAVLVHPQVPEEQSHGLPVAGWEGHGLVDEVGLQRVSVVFQQRKHFLPNYGSNCSRASWSTEDLRSRKRTAGPGRNDR